MQRAVELDPTYALAFAGMAYAYGELADTGTMAPDIAYAHAAEAANRALAISPDCSEAHCVLAVIAGHRDFDWVTAEREFQRSIELNPNNADAVDLYGRFVADLGRFEEAIVLTQRAKQLDPETHRSDHANALLRAGRYHDALEEALRGLELDPSYDRLRATLGWAYIRTGRMNEGIAELEMATALTPTNTAWTAQLGQAYGEAGRFDDARAILGALEEKATREYVSPYHMAYVHLGLGEHDVAMDWLERAYGESAGAIHGVKGSFLFASLRTHPRFIALLERMSLA